MRGRPPIAPGGERSFRSTSDPTFLTSKTCFGSSSDIYVRCADPPSYGAIDRHADRWERYPAPDVADDIDAAVERFRFHDALAAIWRVVEDANRYVVESKPWELARDGDPRLPGVLGNLCATIRFVGTELEPFLPHTAAEILRRVPTPGGIAKEGPSLFPKSL